MKRILVVAPHPDDETLGCGGTLLRHVAEGDHVFWLIATGMSVDAGFSEDKVNRRQDEIRAIAAGYGFKETYQLGFPAARLDRVPMGDLVGAIADIFKKVKPDTLYLPYRNDAHSDHKAVFDAAAACTKSFRYPFIRSVLAYEVLSETGLGIKPEDPGFRPNLFVDISAYLQRKISLMRLYEGEIGDHPFPRSETSITALACLRGSQVAVQSAEAFMILKEIR